MRDIPANIHEQVNTSLASLAICWRITKKDGSVLYGTEHDKDLTVASGEHAGTYLAAFNITGSDIKLSSDLSVDNMEVDGATEQIFGITMRIADIESGILDGASVVVFVCDWTDPSAGQQIVRAGYIGAITRDSDTRYKAEIRGLRQKLSQQLGQNYSEQCNVIRFGDTRCKFNVASITQVCTVTEVVNRKRFIASIDSPGLIPVLATLPRGGEVTWNTGNNTGFTREVKTMEYFPEGFYIELYEEAADEIKVGDSVDIVPGCDRLASTCRFTYNNLDNFRGHGVFIPGALAMMRGWANANECVITPIVGPPPAPAAPPEEPPVDPPPPVPPTFPDPDDPPDPPDFEDEDGESIVWHPGQYAEFQGQSRKDVDQTYRFNTYYDSHIEAFPDVLGVSVCYHWADLEPTRGNYAAGIALVKRELERLATMTPPRRLCLGMRPAGRNLRREEWTMIFPQWMIDAGWVFEIIRDTLGNVHPAISWNNTNPQAKQAFFDLWSALAAGLKTSPYYQYLEMVRPYQEAHWRVSGTSGAVKVQFWKDLAQHLRQQFPTKVVWIPLNGGVNNEDFGEVFDYFITQDVGCGLADTLPRGASGNQQRLAIENRWLLGQEDALDRRPFMAVMAGVEGSELGQGGLGPSSPTLDGYTAREIYDFLNDTIHANYIFWEVIENFGANSQRWFDEGTSTPGGILDIISGETLDHTTKPSNYP